jgi:hypothetical protein
MTEIIGTAWKGGAGSLLSGGGYGIKIKIGDRDEFFRREWGNVQLIIPGIDIPVSVNIDKDSFWNDTCHELISTHLGRWMLSEGLAPWRKGHPPRIVLRRIAPAVFEVHSDKENDE